MGPNGVCSAALGPRERLGPVWRLEAEKRGSRTRPRGQNPLPRGNRTKVDPTQPKVDQRATRRFGRLNRIKCHVFTLRKPNEPTRNPVKPGSKHAKIHTHARRPKNRHSPGSIKTTPERISVNQSVPTTGEAPGERIPESESRGQSIRVQKVKNAKRWTKPDKSA